jgi:energy-coupling factor transporter transmembrane protein EcfT
MRDPRVRLAIVFVALLSALAATSPWVPAALFCVAARPRRLRPLLVPLLFTAGVPVALLVWLRGPDAAALVGARILAATAVATWLTATTPLSQIGQALRWYRVPEALVDLLVLAHRHAVCMREAFETGVEAQRLRLGWSTRTRALRSAGVLAGLTIGRAVDRAQLVADAIAIRGGRQ